MHRISDLDLLGYQAELVLDDRRRLAGVHGVMLVVAAHGSTLFIGSEIPNSIASALSKAVEQSAIAAAFDKEPPALVACRTILASFCLPLSVAAGPSYLIGPDVAIAPQTQIERSDAPLDERLRHLNPGNWDHDEWHELLDGALGPWAMAVVGGTVVSLCHTPGPMTARAAECGVWTHPDHRGRGYAAAVTAAWAALLRPSGRHLFYSTEAENLSSQRVAARLRFRLIGWTWRLASTDARPRDQRHPLSRRSP